MKFLILIILAIGAFAAPARGGDAQTAEELLDVAIKKAEGMGGTIGYLRTELASYAGQVGDLKEKNRALQQEVIDTKKQAKLDVEAAENSKGIWLSVLVGLAGIAFIVAGGLGFAFGWGIGGTSGTRSILIGSAMLGLAYAGIHLGYQVAIGSAVGMGVLIIVHVVMDLVKQKKQAGSLSDMANAVAQPYRAGQLTKEGMELAKGAVDGLARKVLEQELA